MRTFELDGTTYQMPQSWDEIPARQLPQWVELIYLRPAGGAMYHTLLRLALNVSKKDWKNLQQKHFSAKHSPTVRQKNAEVLHQLIQWLSWAWEQPLERQPMGHLSVKGQRWLLPEPGLVTVSFGELSDLYIHLQAFVQANASTGSLDSLDALVATACRPARKASEMQHADWNGDRRETYNEFIARERTPLLASVPYSEKMPVLIFVASSIKAILGKYTLFDSSQADPGNNGEMYAGQGFIKNQHLLAEKGIFGTMKQTQQANAHEVLLFLEEYRSDLLAQQEGQKQEAA